MTMFWIVGIAINVVAFCALIWWAVRNWRQAGERRADGDH